MLIKLNVLQSMLYNNSVNCNYDDNDNNDDDNNNDDNDNNNNDDNNNGDNDSDCYDMLIPLYF